ncbi:MAG: phospholipase A [Rubrivivax sp.]
MGRKAALALAALVCDGARAETPAQCAAVTVDADRLACYDRAFGRQPAATTAPPPTAASASAGGVPTAGNRLAITTAAPPVTSVLSTLWDLEPATKRGTFQLEPYKLNYLLPLQTTTRTNTTPNSPGVDNAFSDELALDPTEAKFQFSVKVKAWQNIFGDNGDLWLAYTQQSSWQLYSPGESSPFRATDYEPGAILSFRTNTEVLGWRWELLNLGFVHQSNGRAQPLSRSWNRVYAQFGFERGDFTVLFKPWLRVKESESSDDNPDIQDYLGSGELRVAYVNGGHAYSALGRYSFSGHRGGLQLEWAFPLVSALKGYVQFTTGYGESLIDYNHSQSTIGIGFLLLPW